MSGNRLIERSRRLYTRLLWLYPQEHRSEYGPAMTQLFADQCRGAQQHGGWPAMLAFWLRTLLDLGKSVLVEQFASPQARAGLLQAVPGSPLPWKGVLLVAIPGLVIFIAQVGQLAGKDWYFKTLAWATYGLMIPILLVWWRARRFPVWGLIPLGIFIQRSSVQLPGFLHKLAEWFSQSPARTLFEPLMARNTGWSSIPLLGACLLVLLVWLVSRRQKFVGPTRRWLGIYGLLLAGRFVFEIVSGLWKQLSYMPAEIRFDTRIIGITFSKGLAVFLQQTSSDIYLSLAFLLLVLLGAMPARRHGTLAILLPLGYLLPTVVVGTYSWEPLNPFLPLVLSAVFAYRLWIAMIAPLWIARAGSRRGQVLAIAVPVTVSLAMQIWVAIAMRGPSTPLEVMLQPILDGLMIMTGSVLAWSLYRSASHEVAAGIPPGVVTQGLSTQ